MRLLVKSSGVVAGKTGDGYRFYKRYISGTRVHVQRYKSGLWHGFVAQRMIRWCIGTEIEAYRWLCNPAIILDVVVLDILNSGRFDNES